MVCPDPTLGTVTNPTGTVGSTSLAGLLDCYSQFQGYVDPPAPGVQAQWQLWSELSNKPDQCARFRANKRYPGEITLRLVLNGWADLGGSAPVTPPAADLPLVLTPFVVAQTSDGVYRQVAVYQATAKNNCALGADVNASGGTVTFTTITTGAAGTVEAAYDLLFGTSRVTGSFVAPFCTTDGCPPRPGTPRCV